YFNAVKIYGKIPYIHPSITTPEEVEEYVNSSSIYFDVNKTVYDKSGLDTLIIIDTIALDKIYLDMDMVIDTFTTQLPAKIKTVGVIHNIDNGDLTWDVTVWNNDAYHALMGEMHLYNSNLTEAYNYFYPILFNFNSENSVKYGLDNKFSYNKWANIFTGIDPDEHILTLQFDKTYQQQHELQSLFSILPPNKYMLKPTRIAVDLWETIWRGQKLEMNATPEESYMDEIGIPGDFSRGHAVSFAYRKNQQLLTESEVRLMLDYKISNNYREIENLMNGVDTVVYKYTLGKNVFDQDANIILNRASNIHLYCSEIYAYWLYDFNDNGLLNTNILKGLTILNNGAYREPPNPAQLGVRGRVGFGDGDDAVYIKNIIYTHDPFTNQVSGYYDFTNNLLAKQEYLEEQILDERARELAYEGYRFYDLIRIAKRRGDPSFLANKVAAKFSGAEADQIREHLMHEENWYIPLPE
ncbi:MAG: RagB/SusD family nutrient uptake outer membrane protein, partial [Bacteroidales bacterium]|nr:RagB/SusD family nutrient uptake outer membrane protein [Bacteroidales bacterium]